MFLKFKGFDTEKGILTFQIYNDLYKLDEEISMSIRNWESSVRYKKWGDAIPIRREDSGVYSFSQKDG